MSSIALLERRRAALKAAGIDDAIFSDEALTPSPETTPVVEERQSETTAEGYYKPQSVRELRDEEWLTVADLLPDNSRSRITNRFMLSAALRFVVQATPWSQIGHGSRWSAVRERMRAARGQSKWTLVLQRLDTITDQTMQAHLRRTVLYLRDGDMRALAKTPWRRIPAEAVEVAPQPRLIAR